MCQKRQRPKRIYLIGFSGSGKSTVGRLLAARLGWGFIDTDEVLAARFGMGISEVFTKQGEAAFRSAESALLREIALRPARAEVIALGGGAFVRQGNRNLVMESGFTVYLQCSQREILRRLKAYSDRPLLAVRPGPGETAAQARQRRVRELFKDRRPVYELARATISTTSRAPHETTMVIIQLYKKLHDGN